MSTWLQREVPCRSVDRHGTIARLAVALMVITTVVSMHASPRVMKVSESKTDIAAATVKKYAYEAYPSWASSHPERRCPVRLVELNELMNNRDVRDPWGNDYEVYCFERGVIVRSLGEDGVAGTQDDVWSH